MTKKKAGLIAFIAFLLAAVYFAGFGGHQVQKQPFRPAIEPVALPTPTAAPKTEKSAGSPEAFHEPQSGRMELGPESKTRPTGSSELAAGVSYSLKKEPDKEVLPGVTVNPGGKGLCIQLPKKDETLQLRRGSGDADCDYQVLWQKKY